MRIVLIFLFSGGIFLLLSSILPGIYHPAERALRARADKRLTTVEIWQHELALKLESRLELDPIRRTKTEALLTNLHHSETPELFAASALSKSIFVAAATSPLLIVSVPLGILSVVLIGIYTYRRQSSSLERELENRRMAIERELPQLCSTVCQTLGQTRDIVSILQSYRRICGEVLAGEIDKTLNDMMTGNAERALRALDSRVNSTKLSQVIRGLLAVLRGDDQRQYFDILTEEFRKQQNEAISRELLARPRKLYPYMGVLFVFLALMIAFSLGTDLVQSLKSFS